MNPYQEEEDYYTPVETRIMRLIYENDVKALRDLKTHLRNLNFYEGFPEVEIDTNITPLILAAHLGRVEILRVLLENENIDVNLGSQELQLTPLCIACAAANFEIVEILTNNGAEINRPDSLNRPPLYFCFIRMQEDSNIFENHLICMKMAIMLLQNGADMNFIVNKEKGKTLLMEYCSINLDMSYRERDTNLKVIKFLLEHGANPALKSKKDKTAMDYASKHPFRLEVQSLLKNTQQIHFYGKSYTSVPVPLPKVKKFSFFSVEGNVRDACCSIFDWCRKKDKAI